MISSGEEITDKLTAANRLDAVILAGGKLPDVLAHRSETTDRALLPHEDRPTIVRTYRAFRDSAHVGRIAIVGPDTLAQIPELQDADLLVPEADSMESNLFSAFARLLPEGRILISACDNPLLTTESLNDFIERTAPEAAACVPIIRHEWFLRKFPRGPWAPVPLKDGSWLPGNCAIIHSRSIPRLQRLLPEVFKRRSDMREVIALLGWKFAWQVKTKRVNLSDIQDRISDSIGLPIRLVKDCDPILAFDVDTVEQWDYLRRWASPVGSRV
jgi:molybdopterin-guanine dinucleotide biosynthesis protein A